MSPLLYIILRVLLVGVAYSVSAWAYLKMTGGRHRLPGYSTWLAGSAAGSLLFLLLEIILVWNVHPAPWQVLWGYPLWNMLAIPCALVPALRGWLFFKNGPKRDFSDREKLIENFRPTADTIADFEHLGQWQRALAADRVFHPFINRKRWQAVCDTVDSQLKKLAPLYNLALAQRYITNGKPADALKRILQVSPHSLDAVLLSLEIPAAHVQALQSLRRQTPDALGLTARQHELLLLEAAQMLAGEHWADPAQRQQAIDTLAPPTSRRRKAYLYHRHGETAQAQEILRDDPAASLQIRE